MLPPGQPRTAFRVVRLLASASLVAFVGTFAAAEADFVRRHRPGTAPQTYLRPQAEQILAPGLGMAVSLAAAAAWLAHRQRYAPRPGVMDHDGV